MNKLPDLDKIIAKFCDYVIIGKKRRWTPNLTLEKTLTGVGLDCLGTLCKPQTHCCNLINPILYKLHPLIRISVFGTFCNK